MLTTPVVRCIAQQIPLVEIHYLCKAPYKNMLETNPYIHTIHLFSKNDGQLLQALKNEKFDYVIDLQNNHRSRSLDRQLKIAYATFPKLNIKKWMLVHFKINRLPALHVVDRYFAATKALPIPTPLHNDGNGLDFFISPEDYQHTQCYTSAQPYIAIAVGSQHKTKQLPLPKLIAVCEQLTNNILLLGGKEDRQTADDLCSHSPKTMLNLCGKLSLRESAACLDKAKIILTGDTGLMHISAALNKRIVSVWGNTVPAFGMYPYLPKHPDQYHIIENKTLKCRPCSKLGFKKCPKKHFRCMNEIDSNRIITLLNE
jgi:ADP-heptose:LPS heptosyltransferase